MWANAQRDGRPVKYRWCPLFNAAKLGWRPLLECRAVTLSRRETRWHLQGCTKLTNWSQPLGRSSPYCEDMLRRYCCLTRSFSDYRYVPYLRRYSLTKLCDGAEMASFLAIFCVLYFKGAACCTFQTWILNSNSGHTICGSMLDIQSATAEIIWGKEEKERKKKQDKNIMSASATQGNHNSVKNFALNKRMRRPDLP